MLSLGEIKEVFKGKQINDDDWKKIIEEADDNGDGNVIFPLFFPIFSIKILYFSSFFPKNFINFQFLSLKIHKMIDF